MDFRSFEEEDVRKISKRFSKPIYISEFKDEIETKKKRKIVQESILKQFVTQILLKKALI